MDIYETISLAKRLGYSFSELKEISFTSLVNLMLSTVESDTKEATQEDIRNL